MFTLFFMSTVFLVSFMAPVESAYCDEVVDMDYHTAFLYDEKLYLGDNENNFEFELSEFVVYKITQNQETLSYVSFCNTYELYITLIIEFWFLDQIRLIGYTTFDGEEKIFSSNLNSSDILYFDLSGAEISYDTLYGAELYHKRDVWNTIYMEKQVVQQSFALSRSTDSSYIEEAQLAEVTKDDSYINTYQNLDHYNVDERVTDRIVSIIPETWFFDVGIHTYIGEEYFIYVQTVWQTGLTLMPYESHVFIYDYDFKTPSASDGLEYNKWKDDSSINYNIDSTSQSYNISLLGKPVINSKYFGFGDYSTRYDGYFYSDKDNIVIRADVDDTWWVLSGLSKNAPNLYFVPEYASVSADEGMNNQNDEYNVEFEYFEYAFNIDEESVDSAINIDSAVTAVSTEFLIAIIETRFDEIYYGYSMLSTLIEYLFMMGETVSDIGYEDYVDISLDYDTSGKYIFQIFGTDSTRPSVAIFDLDTSVANYVAANSMNYDAFLNVKMCAFSSTLNYETMLCDIESSVSFKLYDSYGASIGEYYSVDYVESNNKFAYAQNVVDLYNGTTLTFNYEIGYSEDAIPIRISEQGILTFNLNWWSKYEISLYTIDGGIVSTNIMQYKNYTSIFVPYDYYNELYFVKVKHLDAGYSTVTATYTAGYTTLTTTQTISSTTSASAILLRVESSALAQEFVVSTTSSVDTIITVFDRYGGEIVESDNPFINSSSDDDYEDLNACAYVTNNCNYVYYILVSWDNLYSGYISITSRVIEYSY